jgi:uncharacterized protein (DUF3084 family)
MPTTVRYSTDEERKKARAASSRRYREKQRTLLSSITPQSLPNPEHERLDSELALITNRYRHLSDHLDALQSSYEKLQEQVSQLIDNTVTTAQLQGFRDNVVAEFKRVETAKRLPISITHKP